LNPRKQNILTLIRMVVDLGVVCFTWILAYDMRFNWGIEVTKGRPEAVLYFKLLPFILVIWLAVFLLSGFYRRSTKHRSAVIEAIDIFQSCALATLGFIAFTYFYEEYRYSRIVLVIFTTVHPVLLIFGRSLVRKALRVYRRRATPRKTLIIGAGEFLKTAISMSKLGEVAPNDIAGVILVGDDEQVERGRQICRDCGYKEIMMPSDWPSFFTENPMHAVVIGVPYQKFNWIDKHLEDITNQVPDVKLLPDLMKFTKFAAGIELISGVPVISVHESPLAGVQGLIKRGLDIFGAIAALILFSPVMLITALLVKLSSSGPVFYSQERMGIDGKTFRMFKFRSMPVNAESASGAVFATAGDNRATPVGKMLRRTSLDELPQFFNVLIGDMSLVGPRPERPVFVNDFRRSIPGYFLRHKVKSGITGWAQVNGWRGDTSIEKRIECDLYYIQNWSFWLDLRIIALTVIKGFMHKNAY
jgi:Undecaprenyl-phosphate glucose phosphotransferase